MKNFIQAGYLSCSFSLLLIEFNNRLSKKNANPTATKNSISLKI